MISVDTIREVKFEKTAVFGYKAEDVDEFLAEVAKDYEMLIDEKEDMENKLSVLAESIENYREQEESLKTTLLAAQKLSDQIMRDAKTKAEGIIADAEKRAAEIDKDINDRKKNLQKQIEKEMAKEKATLLKLQSEVTSFKSNLLELYKRHLDMIAVIPEFENERNTETEINEETAPVQEETVTPEVEAQMSEETVEEVANKPEESVEEVSKEPEETVEDYTKESDDSIFNGLVFDSEENN